MDRGGWQAIVRGVSKESDMTKHSRAPTKGEFQFSLSVLRNQCRNNLA